MCYWIWALDLVIHFCYVLGFTFTMSVSFCRFCVLSHFSHVWFFVTPIDYSPLGSSVHEILQARLLEWVAMPFSGGSSQARDWTYVSCVSCKTWHSLPRNVSLILHELYRSVYYIKTATCLLPCLLEDLQLQFSSSLTTPSKFSLKSQVLHLTWSFLSLTAVSPLVPNYLFPAPSP